MDEILSPTRLSDRRIVITGGAVGIGRATARRAKAEGAQVFLLDLNAAALDQTCRELGCKGVSVDVTDESSVETAITQAEQAMGGIDGLVNSAGIMMRGSIIEVDPATWRRVLEINMTGPYIVTRACFPHLAKGSAVVNIGSAQALLPNSPNRAAYCASKGGILNLSRALAAEFAPDIRVNTICPGLVDTDMADGVRQNAVNYALKRLAQPDEIAAAICFLLSREASFITGAALAVDGGRSFH